MGRIKELFCRHSWEIIKINGMTHRTCLKCHQLREWYRKDIWVKVGKEGRVRVMKNKWKRVTFGKSKIR